MAYQRKSKSRTIAGVLLAIIAILAVSCGGAAEPTAEPGSPAPTAAAPTAAAPTQAPAAQAPSQPATSVPAPATRAAPTGATPVPQPQATATPVATAPAMAKPEGTLNIGYKDLYNFDTHPRITPATVGLYVGTSIGESLFARDVKGAAMPKLIKEWSLSPDNLVWTFKLQEGVQFHKGYGEMTAEDIIWSMEQYSAEDAITSIASRLRRLWANPKGSVTAIDDYTIEVNTGDPQYDMLDWTSVPYAGWIVSKKQVDELGDEVASRDGASTGPFEIVEHQTGESWTMKAVEDHWRKTPNFAELVYWEIPEESTRVANFLTGVLDTFTMELDSMSALEQEPGVKFMRVEGGGTIHIGWYGNFYVGHGEADHAEKRPGYDPELPWVSANPDVTSEEWQNAVKVRRAMSIAVDRQLIVDTILSGQGRPLVLWGWEAQLHRLDPDIRAGWEFNPEKAKQLLVEAGYPDGFEITLTPDIRGVPGEREATQALAPMWEEIGISTRLNQVPFATIFTQIKARTYNQINTHGTGGRTDPLSLMIPNFESSSGFNGGFEHPYTDEMINKAIKTVDEEERYKILTDIARFTFDNVAEAGLYEVDILWPLSEKIAPWKEHLEHGDRRILNALEYAPHRK